MSKTPSKDADSRRKPRLTENLRKNASCSLKNCAEKDERARQEHRREDGRASRGTHWTVAPGCLLESNRPSCCHLSQVESVNFVKGEAVYRSESR